jgi:heme/copper-type cytochrome/quinol oxidase subunit 2
LNFYQTTVTNFSKNFFISKSCLFYTFSQLNDIDFKNTYITLNLPYFFEVEQFQKSTNNLLPGELRLLEVSSDFVLPVDKMIKLVITSIDVLHC